MTRSKVWDYSRLKKPRPYGATTTYQLALNWLKTCPLIEDWGCGSGYFGTLLPETITYRGLDGSTSPWGSPSEVSLTAYTSQVPGILIRHVLEHNWAWETILKNALTSFTQRLCLILFVPVIDGEQVVNRAEHGGIPDLALPRGRLVPMLSPYLKDLEILRTRSQYRSESLYCLERPCEM